MSQQDGNHPDDLLPWLVNGSLQGEEQEWVTQHVEGCVVCRAEVELLQRVRREVKQINAAKLEDDLGLARLLRQVRKEPPERRVSAWWQYAAAAAMVLVVGQFGLLVTRFEGGAVSGDPSLYVPLGDPAPTLQVKFQSGATEADIRALLNRIDGRIVGGPGMLGIYQVELLVNGVPERSESALEAAARLLREQPDIVEHASP